MNNITYVDAKAMDYCSKINSTIYDLQKTLYTSKFRLIRNIKIAFSMSKMQKINKQIKKEILMDMITNPKEIVCNMNLLCKLYDFISEHGQIKLDLGSSFTNLGATYKIVYRYVETENISTLTLTIPNYYHTPASQQNSIDFIYSIDKESKINTYLGSIDPENPSEVTSLFIDAITYFINKCTTGLINNAVLQYYDWRG